MLDILVAMVQQTVDQFLKRKMDAAISSRQNRKKKFFLKKAYKLEPTLNFEN